MSAAQSELREYQPDEFAGKTVVVTGGSSGIGKATAEVFHAQRARVHVMDIGEKPVFLSDDAFWKADMADDRLIDGTFANIASREKGIDIIVHSAAIKIPGAIRDLTRADIERMLTVNMGGLFSVAKHGGEHLRASHGTFVVVCSGDGPDLPPGVDGYFMSKGGSLSTVHAMHATSGKEFHVRGISPGPVDTPLWRTGQSSEGIQSALRGERGPEVLTADTIATMILKVASQANESLDGKVWTYPIE